MEATAISLGKAVLGGALNYAKSKAAEEVALQLGVEDDVVFITDELQMMQSFLMTADEERSQSKVLTTWVTQVRETAYNVEDSLMDFGLHAGKKPICGCIPRNLCDRRRIAKEVKKLRAKVEDVSNRNLRYRLIKDGSSSKAADAAEQAASAGDAMFGINKAMIAAVELEKSKADLLQLVTAKEVELRVMAVWGTTGDHGKTAAIHEVYDHPSVTSRYGFRAWVKLIHPFNPIEFLHSIVRQFFENDKPQEGGQVTNVGASVLLKMDKMNHSDLVQTFTAQLGNNSYLIVINDLRTIEEWLCIRRYFPDNMKQSRIIVSTQQAELGRLCTEQPYQMSEFKQLSYDQTLYLFHKKNLEKRTNTASVSNFDKSQEAKPVDLEERTIDENPKMIYAINELDWTNTASVSTFEKSQEAKPADLEERTNDENPKMIYATNKLERTNTASVSSFDKSQEAKTADLEERTNDENLKMIYATNELVWTNTASVSNFDKNQEAMPADLEERTNDENPKMIYATNEPERTNTTSVSNFDKIQGARLADLEEWTNDENPKMTYATNEPERTNTASLSNFDKSQEANPANLEERTKDENPKMIYATNELERTNTARVSNFDKSQEAKPVDLEEWTNNENLKMERTKTASVSNFDKSQEAKPTNLEEHTNDENPRMVLPLSETEPICDPATPSSEIQEYERPKSTSGGNHIFDPTAAVPRKMFDRTRTMVLDDELLVGRMTEKSKVINLIGKPKDDQHCKVISVWGMGGIGKTTLVRSIYRSQQLGGWKRAWVTALRPFKPEVLIRTIALQLLTDDPSAETRKETKNNLAAMRLDELTEKLIKHLEEHECLIVLDDLYFTEEWNLIRDQLEKAKRIIVTTRKYNVARYCSGGHINTHQLHVLEEKEAEELFVKKVFKDHVEKCHLDPDMLDQAALIIKKCHGLPLAISTIGGFLATKPKTATEWRKVNDHLPVELDINPELRNIKTVLMRSYDGLPYHLKSAFLYMSIFPEDYKIKRKRLIRRWIAEGYCREMRGMAAEEVGDKYFTELLDRSMILLGEGATQYDGTINSCQLHDLIREICMLKAREENLVFTLEEGCCLSDAQGTIRHLVIGSNWKRDKDVLESMVDLSHVRSLTVFGDWKPFFISDKMRFLRVLDLGDTLGLRDHHLDKIGQLLHLRYLSIRGCRNIFSLPSSLGNLRHLQTLDGRGTNIVRFPSTITKLQKLERLLASGDDWGGRQQGQEDVIITQLDEHEGCHVLMESVMRFIPDDMEDHLLDDTQAPIRKNNCCTSSLYHIRMCLAQTLFRLFVCLFCWRPQALDDGLNRRDLFNMQSTFYALVFGGVEAPRGIRKMKALHTLGVVNVSRSKSTLKELKKLTQLHKLGVAGVHSKYSKKFWSAISGLKQLRSLSVMGYGLDTCLGEDLLPPMHLESLKLEGKLFKVTKWILTLQNLLKLQLEETEIDSDVLIKAIGQLPILKVLDLRSGAFVPLQELCFQGPSFPSLVLLELRVGRLREVSFEEHAMPKLEVIHSDHFSMYEIHGLAFLPSLKEIRLGSSTDYTLKENLKSKLQKEGLNHVSLKLL